MKWIDGCGDNDEIKHVLNGSAATNAAPVSHSPLFRPGWLLSFIDFTRL